MTWLLYVFLGWLSFGIIGTAVLYVGYGFTMSAIRAEKDGLSPRHVYYVDAVIAWFFILLDGLLNAFFYSGFCIDPRPRFAFRTVTVRGVTFPFFELMTERFSRYSEKTDELWWRRKVALFFALFLDGKDPKGWHIRPSPKP